jgi:putative transposase
MTRKQFSEEQIIGILKEAEAGAVVTELCRKHAMSSANYYAWKAKYGGLEVSDAKRLRALEEANGKLKRLLADAMLDNKDVCGVVRDLGWEKCDVDAYDAAWRDAGRDRTASTRPIRADICSPRQDRMARRRKWRSAISYPVG